MSLNAGPVREATQLTQAGFKRSAPLDQSQPAATKETPPLQHSTQHEDGSYHLSDPALNALQPDFCGSVASGIFFESSPRTDLPLPPTLNNNSADELRSLQEHSSSNAPLHLTPHHLQPDSTLTLMHREIDPFPPDLTLKGHNHLSNDYVLRSDLLINGITAFGAPSNHLQRNITPRKQSRAEQVR